MPQMMTLMPIHSDISSLLSSPSVLAGGGTFVILGPNASGKSRAVDSLIPLIPSCRYLSFRDTYGAFSDNEYFLQLRFNHGIQDDALLPTVGETLCAICGDDPQKSRNKSAIVDFLGLGYLLPKKLVLLSSGELRRLQIVKALLHSPRCLILDNPFVGLDKDARVQVRSLLERLDLEEGMSILLVLSREEEVPSFARCIFHTPAVEGINSSGIVLPHSSSPKVPSDLSPEIISMRGVCVKYGSRYVLRDVDWTVRRGERWSLQGPNGSGKSTLLSLVMADHPQRYSNDIHLFGAGSRSGVSIWDIKRRIGYVSPELHRSFYRNVPAVAIVASGLRDGAPLRAVTSPSDREISLGWMEAFGVGGLSERSFVSLSSGEQRLLLLSRAFVKDPELLILDEPMHALDCENEARVRDVISAFCTDPSKTLVMVSHNPSEFPPCIDRSLVLPSRSGED